MYGRQNVEQLLADINNPNEQVALEAALKFLYIDKNSFANIHLVEIKKEFLLYKFLHAEYRICKQIFGAQAERWQHVAERAYKRILDSGNADRVKEGYTYSKFSYSLYELDLSSTNEELAAEELAELEESMLKVGEKKGGVEPGFEAIHIKDVLFYLFENYPDKQERIKVIKSYNCDVKKLHEKFDLPIHMIKHDYKDVTDDGRVVVNKADLMKAQTMQDLYAMAEIIGDIGLEFFRNSKSVTSIAKNCEGVLEGIGTDIARLLYPTQNLRLRKKYYERTGALKIVLDCTKIKGAKPLGPLAGGKNYDNYCVTRVVLPADRITAISDTSMPFLAEKLPIFIVQNDRDAIGSKGQNKLIKDNDIAGIDYGHVYQSIHSLLDKLTSHFHILHPKFKNYSIFYDSKLSVIIRGLIKLAVLSGMKVDDRVLSSYGADFAAEVKGIIPHSDEKIFDDHIHMYSEKVNEVKESNKPDKQKHENMLCYRAIVEYAVAAKQRHIRDRDGLLRKFAFYLSFDMHAIDLLDSLKKLTSPRNKISLRSPDDTVLLNHIRVSDDDLAEWQLKVGYQDQHTLTGTFDSVRLARQALEAIKSMLPDPDNADHVKLVQNGKTISFTFDKINLIGLANIFNEEKIKRKLFPEEMLLFKRFQAERSLVNLFETFKQYGVQADLKATADNQQYALSFTAIPPNSIEPAFQFFLKKTLDALRIPYVDVHNKISFTVLPNVIEVLEEKLATMAHDMAEMKQSHATFEDIITIIRNHDKIANLITLVLHEAPDGCFSLELINLDSASKDARRCSILFEMLLRKEFDYDKMRFEIPYERLGVLNRVLQDCIGEHEKWQKLFISSSSVRSSSVFQPASSEGQTSVDVDPSMNRKHQ